MKNTGLVELAKALHVDDKTFSDIWEPSKG